MVQKSHLNHSATLNSHMDHSRRCQMPPVRLSAKQYALRCSKTSSPALLNNQEDVKYISSISRTMYGCHRNATKSNYLNVQYLELLGVLAGYPILFRCISNLELNSLGVSIMMFISNTAVQFSSSATTLVCVGNTWVFRTALLALTECRTL
jgi:hypothetical protein